MFVTFLLRILYTFPSYLARQQLQLSRRLTSFNEKNKKRIRIHQPETLFFCSLYVYYAAGSVGSKFPAPLRGVIGFFPSVPLKDIICLVLSIHNVDNRTIAVFIYPFCISNTCTDTTMGCRLSKLQVLSNRKIITVRLTAGNRMNKDSSLSASIYMSSVLSPGLAPSMAAIQHYG